MNFLNKLFMFVVRIITLSFASFCVWFFVVVLWLGLLSMSDQKRFWLIVFGEAMKVLRTIYSIVLLTAFSNAYGGTCFIKPYDVGDCLVKAEPGFFTKGDATAQTNLGIMYSTGRDVSQDYKEAVKWYRLAAEQGNATAQNNLGEMYAKGEGISKDIKEAVKWFRLAAEQGYAYAQFILGVLYEHG